MWGFSFEARSAEHERTKVAKRSLWERIRREATETEGLVLMILSEIILKQQQQIFI